jgi:hypothetical protein
VKHRPRLRRWKATTSLQETRRADRGMSTWKEEDVRGNEYVHSGTIFPRKENG